MRNETLRNNIESIEKGGYMIVENIYWIQEWAKVRQSEVVRLPDSFEVHDCFLNHMSGEEFDSTFKEIWNVFTSIYGDIAKFPETFGMPLHKSQEYAYSTKEARESRNAAYRPLKLLYYLLIAGDLQNGTIIVDVNKFKAINDIKCVPVILERLSNYGFYFDGLKNFKITSECIYMLYPDSSQILTILKLMADKAHITNRINDFLACHYKLFQDDMNTANYGYGADIIADKMHTKHEKEFVYAMDAVLSEMGYYVGSRESNEGPGYAYYSKESEIGKKGPYHYLMSSNKTKLLLYLRIRNVSKCLDYLKECPDSVKQIFLLSDTGCSNRTKGTCIHGQEYAIDGSTYWRCGCCNASFYFSPIIKDIPHYINLVKLGLKK
ncbi:MAG: hypothetical protein K0R09_551 [Clostridiales bacterium]|jgi:hypothetical protein|nr:hypothetical protein [Clostridiales bacterium]